MANKNYISYFQSVITLGVMSTGKSKREAQMIARNKLSNKDGINYCAFDQTPFELTETEEWNPELKTMINNDEEVSFNFNPDEDTQNIIATRIGKRKESLTREDIRNFVKQSIQNALTS